MRANFANNIIINHHLRISSARHQPEDIRDNLDTSIDSGIV